MKRLLVSACCLAILGCAHPSADSGRPRESKPKPSRQARNEARRKSLHEFNHYLDSIKTVGVVHPDVLMYELTAGGIGEIIDEWSDQASERFTEAVTRELQTRNMTVKPVEATPADDRRMENVKYLYRAISDSLSWNTTYRKAVCPDVQVCPDFSLGRVEFLFRDPSVEALLFVLAYNDVPAAEPPPPPPDPSLIGSERIATAPQIDPAQRKRKKSKRSYAMVNGTVLATGTYVSMALVDRQGNILWYGGKATRKGEDLREQSSVDEMTSMVLSLLRAREKQ